MLLLNLQAEHKDWLYINAKLTATSLINVSRNCTIHMCGPLSIMDQAFGEPLSEHVLNRFRIELAGFIWE